MTMLRAILQSVALYIDIGNVRTIKIMAGLMGPSLLLQLITFTTPGWRVYKNTEEGKVEYMALMYDVRCDEKGCKTYPVSEDEYKKEWQFHYITWIIKGLVPILLCSVSLCLLLFSIRKPKWREPFFFFSTWSLGIATVLQWDLMASFADIHRMVLAHGLLRSENPVPWNVILHAISAFLTTTVMLVSLLILMKKLILNVMADDKMEEPLLTNLDDFQAQSHI
ncbi:hypothetical protein CHS0354_026605 [Potamilus streckersoni]|uniref:Uncharacterized protein n=1 Tax=Potamilus streckersoni TaxID=2493646 RepID=A0AAE0SUW8_9BIVA|nr:hypothetical protein CHS0354_026605 [Potamilus streckersoni]